MLSFAAPWALAALAALPALWWLLRVTPPAPRRVVFPPLRLLLSLSSREESAVRTPWWLLALRLALLVALIVGIARPVLDAGGMPGGSGPIYLVIDNGWASAPGWEAREAVIARMIDRAEREGRGIVLMPTAPANAEDVLAKPSLLPVAKARELARALRPLPWPTERSEAISALLRAAHDAGWPPGTIVWISDGLAEAPNDETAAALLERMRALGRPLVLLPKSTDLPILLKPASGYVDGPELVLVRPSAGGELPVGLRLLAEDGTPLSRQTLHFLAGERYARARIELPTELSGRLVRIDVEGAATAAGVVLIDERWQRRAVGLLGEGGTAEQPLLGGQYYLQRALQPFAEVRQGDLDQLLARPLAAIVLTDVGTLDAGSAQTLSRWVEQGGVLLRFAGPRLAREASPGDPLLPVPLRAGDRTIGGTLSWSGAGRLAAFDPQGPLQGLSVAPDVEIRRQVIAEPSLDTAGHTWARLDDGTPLITGARRGEGWVVLVHTTADPDWSNLPLSGLFVDILRRIINLGQGGRAGREAATLPPLETLDGFGRLGPPPPETRAIAGADFATALVAPGRPPGFYGTTEARRALNLGASVADPLPLPLPRAVDTVTLGDIAERDLRPWLLGLALLLMIVDFGVSLSMRGLLRPRAAARGHGAGRVALALMLIVYAAGDAGAQTVVADGTAAPASLTTRLAWIRSGDANVDAVSAAGLAGLSLIVNRRTAAELGEPVGIDPETDELAFYPLLYWPVGEGLRPLSANAARKLTAYMRGGGTIVFDTRGRDDGSDRAALRDLAHALDLPPLIPVPSDHVLRRSYYLLPEMPGRRAGGTVWVEQSGEHVNDGVSSVVAGSADWAGAWALDSGQRPMFPAVPGGERQREQAYRVGVNLVMYVLTGNYKADQVHLPTIMERLGP